MQIQWEVYGDHQAEGQQGARRGAGGPPAAPPAAELSRCPEGSHWQTVTSRWQRTNSRSSAALSGDDGPPPGSACTPSGGAGCICAHSSARAEFGFNALRSSYAPCFRPSTDCASAMHHGGVCRMADTNQASAQCHARTAEGASVRILWPQAWL
jgi:hypothetical protein